MKKSTYFRKRQTKARVSQELVQLKQVLGLWFIFCLVVVFVLFAFSSKAAGADFFVTSVVRELPMKPGENSYKDFYINAGSANGLQTGMSLVAIRSLENYDNLNRKMLNNAMVKVANLKLIHVDKHVSIARLVNMLPKEETPLSGFDSVMIGDRIEVTSR
ncbi:MAG: hypothetical protein AB7F43_00975 [Bacteriovoracia bacterium]